MPDVDFGHESEHEPSNAAAFAVLNLDSYMKIRLPKYVHIVDGNFFSFA
ncbi:hypothetical protein XSR1_250004 [Xenorhabdus szentirmaii DSM 16338]|uniref:Uncharacterized protein n=1 Tax=Xenorhabdus szentirmaii DSM 16338 TaxID=1427518 RepID=W1IWE5_9GAMM|nr:hypothetical protein XSR1_250004 [Xenorhabdus szentirmaii DSM 16338]